MYSFLTFYNIDLFNAIIIFILQNLYKRFLDKVKKISIFEKLTEKLGIIFANLKIYSFYNFEI